MPLDATNSIPRAARVEHTCRSAFTTSASQPFANCKKAAPRAESGAAAATRPIRRRSSRPQAYRRRLPDRPLRSARRGIRYAAGSIFCEADRVRRAGGSTLAAEEFAGRDRSATFQATLAAATPFGTNLDARVQPTKHFRFPGVEDRPATKPRRNDVVVRADSFPVR